MKNITVYTKNGCPQCDMTKTVLKGEGIDFKIINVEDDTEEGREGLHFVKEVLQLSSMPVVIVDGEEPFTGFRPDKLQELK